MQSTQPKRKKKKKKKRGGGDHASAACLRTRACSSLQKVVWRPCPLNNNDLTNDIRLRCRERQLTGDLVTSERRVPIDVGDEMWSRQSRKAWHGHACLGVAIGEVRPCQEIVGGFFGSRKVATRTRYSAKAGTKCRCLEPKSAFLRTDGRVRGSLKAGSSQSRHTAPDLAHAAVAAAAGVGDASHQRHFLAVHGRCISPSPGVAHHGRE